MEILDLETALIYCDNDQDMLKEILGSFRRIWPQVIEELRVAIAAQDALQVEKRAHFLKGRARTIVANEVAQAAYRLEEMGEKKLLAEAPQALHDLTGALTRLEDHLVQNGLT